MTENCGCDKKSHKFVAKNAFKPTRHHETYTTLLSASKCSKMRKNKTLMDALQSKSNVYYSDTLGYPNICTITKDLFGDHALNCWCIRHWINNRHYFQMLKELQRYNLPIRQGHINYALDLEVDQYFDNQYFDDDKIAALLIAKSGLTDRYTSLPLKSLQTAAYDLTYKRIMEICLAMQDLQLPALVTYKIVKHACRFLCPGAKAKMNDVWKIITKIKHFH